LNAGSFSNILIYELHKDNSRVSRLICSLKATLIACIPAFTFFTAEELNNIAILANKGVR
jgi:hypothetical protein